jgi:hypothetical protein
MEITLNEDIGALLDEVQHQRYKPATRPAVRRGNGSRCNCGSCPTCQDNARWERVFNEKFADPDYYSPREIRRGSSLSM